jgi:hypothetical protein
VTQARAPASPRAPLRTHSRSHLHSPVAAAALSSACSRFCFSCTVSCVPHPLYPASCAIPVPATCPAISNRQNKEAGRSATGLGQDHRRIRPAHAFQPMAPRGHLHGFSACFSAHSAQITLLSRQEQRELRSAPEYADMPTWSQAHQVRRADQCTRTRTLVPAAKRMRLLVQISGTVTLCALHLRMPASALSRATTHEERPVGQHCSRNQDKCQAHTRVHDASPSFRVRRRITGASGGRA